MRTGVTTAPDVGNNCDDILKLSESLFRWSGWSLSHRRLPGRTEMKPEDKESGYSADLSSQSAANAPVEVNYRVKPKSLPRLRFGRKYRFRVRTVDLAGNSLPPPDDTSPQPNLPGSNDPHEWTASGEASYLRWQPILPPALALVGKKLEGPKYELAEQDKPLDGESMQQMAIRTLNGGQSGLFKVMPAPGSESGNPSSMLEPLDPDAIAMLSLSPSGGRARRMVVPPRVPVSEAEQMAMLDGGADANRVGGRPQSSYKVLAEKDSPLQKVRIELMNSGGILEQVTYSVLGANSSLPYLPDPYMEGLVANIYGLPNGSSKPETVVIPLYLSSVPELNKEVTESELNGSPKEWPEAQPFQLILTNDDGQSSGLT